MPRYLRARPEAKPCFAWDSFRFAVRNFVASQHGRAASRFAARPMGYARIHTLLLLMLEVAFASEAHGHVVCVRCGNHFFIADGTSWVNE